MLTRAQRSHAVRAEPGVASVTETGRSGGLVQFNRYLEGGAGLGASYATITALRDGWRRYPVRARSWVARSATDLDTNNARATTRK